MVRKITDGSGMEPVRKRGAFTLVELLVVIGIIALLISILLPALQKARAQANIVKCCAQLKDFGNALVMYTMDYKGYFPGPCLGQCRSGYESLDPNGKAAPLPDYLWPYLHLPAPPAFPDQTRLPMHVLQCPASVGLVQGQVADTDFWTYQFWDYDPPATHTSHRAGEAWFGYSSAQAKVNGTLVTVYPNRMKELGRTDPTLPLPPMRITQVYKPSDTGIISDADKALFLFDENYVQADLGMPGAPAHGGKPETSQGLQGPAGGNWDGTGSDYKVYNPIVLGSQISKAATNPPRNVLFADGHVSTIRQSGPPPLPFR